MGLAYRKISNQTWKNEDCLLGTSSVVGSLWTWEDSSGTCGEGADISWGRLLTSTAAQLDSSFGWACFCRIKLLLDNNPTSKHSIYCGTKWPKLESRQMINWSYVQMVYLVNQIHVYTYVCIILSCIGLRRCVSFLCTELFPGTGTEVFYFQIIGQQQNCAFTPIFWGTVPPLPSPPQQK